MNSEIPPTAPRLNKGQLLAALGFPKHSKFITACCFYGFPMPGGRSTVGRLEDWLDENPTVSTSRYEVDVKKVKRRKRLRALREVSEGVRD